MNILSSVILAVGLMSQVRAYPFSQNIQQDEPTNIYLPPGGSVESPVLPYPLLVTSDGDLIDQDDFITAAATDDDDDDTMGNQINHRAKRQLADIAAGLASTHVDFDKDGVATLRDVGKIYPAAHYVNGQFGPLKHWNAGVGASSVLWRSKNNKHSIGVGAYGAMAGAKVHGYDFHSKPQFGAGFGYNFRW